MIPFSSQYKEFQDLLLLQQAKKGSKQALEQPVKNHQRFIYNLALKFLKDPDEAADLTQEVLIIRVTKLSQFNGKSSFRTWLYRIVVNHFLKSKKRKSELEVHSFEAYRKFLDHTYTAEEMAEEEQKQYQDLITNTRNQCMTGRLLCLDQQQRMVFILGAIFHLKSTVVARCLQDITAENFRQQLARAKADLFQFMKNKCGLVNLTNPCPCYKKTKGFIREGKVDPAQKKFTVQTLGSVQSNSGLANVQLDQLIEKKYLSFFMEQPYEDCQPSQDLLTSLLVDQEIKNLFRLN